MKSRYQYEAALGFAPRQPNPHSSFGAWLRSAFSLRLRWPKSEPRPRDQMHLDEHLLQDMGLTRSYADRPVVRPYWRA